MMRVQTISKETIKPSSSTPPHPKSIPLSLLDHFAPPIYTHLLLFYSTNPPELPTRLKSSLSETLKHFYPLAGRIIDDYCSTLHVDCTDDGVEFIEAQAESDLDSLLLHPPIGQFTDLLPIKPGRFTNSDPLLAVQLTAFKGDGFALGISILHKIADSASMATFLNRWSEVACGLQVDSLHPPRFDSASIFPPHPRVTHKPEPDRSPSSEKEEEEEEEEEEAEAVRKRFVVSPRAMERLRNGSYDRAQPATRVEAVTALVWRCLVRARGAEGRESWCPPACHVVDLRRKISPPLSGESFGNLWDLVVAEWDGDGGQGSLEAAMRRAVRGADGHHVRRRMESGAVKKEDVGFVFSSWCRMPFYRTDFGCGDPVWVGCEMREVTDFCVLMDTKDGDGVEVWLWLTREEMERIERDPEFIKFVGSTI